MRAQWTVEQHTVGLHGQFVERLRSERPFLFVGSGMSSYLNA